MSADDRCLCFIGSSLGIHPMGVAHYALERSSSEVLHALLGYSRPWGGSAPLSLSLALEITPAREELCRSAACYVGDCIGVI